MEETGEIEFTPYIYGVKNWGLCVLYNYIYQINNLTKIKMKKILILMLVVISNFLLSQTVIINNRPGLNSEQTKIANENADYLYGEVTNAFKNNEIVKARYYLDQWNHCIPCRDGRFYASEGQYWLGKGHKTKARRMYMKAYRNYACFECKEKADNIK